MKQGIKSVQTALKITVLSARITFLSVIAAKHPSERRALKLMYRIQKLALAMGRAFPAPQIPDEIQKHMERTLTEAKKLTEN